jgi:beta-glucosidase
VYSHYGISSEKIKAGETLDISVTLTNTGNLAGDEVVQLYVRDEYGSIPRPVKELKGFTRISLQPGETRKVTFHLPVDMLAFYDENLQLVVERGTFKAMIGSSSMDIRAEGTFEVTGEKKSPVRERVFVCLVEVK